MSLRYFNIISSFEVVRCRESRRLDVSRGLVAVSCVAHDRKLEEKREGARERRGVLLEEKKRRKKNGKEEGNREKRGRRKKKGRSSVRRLIGTIGASPSWKKEGH